MRMVQAQCGGVFRDAILIRGKQIAGQRCDVGVIEGAREIVKRLVEQLAVDGRLGNYGGDIHFVAVVHLADAVYLELLLIAVNVDRAANLDYLACGIGAVNGALVIPKLCVDLAVGIRKHEIKILRTLDVQLELNGFDNAEALHLTGGAVYNV